MFNVKGIPPSYSKEIEMVQNVWLEGSLDMTD
jgi:hypothetical protein